MLKKIILLIVLMVLIVGCTHIPANSMKYSIRTTNDFIDNKDGTVKHKLTGLTWMRCAIGQTWNKETSTCKGSTDYYFFDNAKSIKSDFAGKSDWRLPSLDELLSLSTRTSIHQPVVKTPDIDTTIFPNVIINPQKQSWFWSSTMRDNTKTVIVDLNLGEIGKLNGDNCEECAVMLVSGGHWTLDSLPLTEAQNEQAAKEFVIKSKQEAEELAALRKAKAEEKLAQQRAEAEQQRLAAEEAKCIKTPVCRAKKEQEEQERQERQRERARQEREEEEIRRKEYTESHPPCYSGDSCYDLTQTNDPRSMEITCTRGPYTGEKSKLCGDGKGKWGTCGDLGLYYHYDADGAARLKCNLH